MRFRYLPLIALGVLAIACGDDPEPEQTTSPAADAGTVSYADGGGQTDTDGDGIVDADDNCWAVANPDQKDTDKDNHGDLCDNCPKIPDMFQTDHDNDGKGDVCDADPPKKMCGIVDAKFSQLRANIFLLLDKSGSMQSDSKMTQAKVALDRLAKDYWDKLQFGFAYFPGKGDSCAAPTRTLGMGQHSHSKVRAAYTSLTPGGATPMAEALATVHSKGWYKDPNDAAGAARKGAVVLITDGKPNCNKGSSSVASEAAKLYKAGVPVHVVGFGSGVTPATLDAVAKAGGTNNPKDPSHRYYKASNATDLGKVLASISSSLVSCTIALANKPPDHLRIYVLLNGKALNRAAADGWSYSAANNTMTLKGSACTALKGASAGKVRIIFGCPASSKVL